MCKWQTKVNFWALAVIDYQSLSHFLTMNKENNSRQYQDQGNTEKSCHDNRITMAITMNMIDHDHNKSSKL